ncbi:MAG: hypothetical protein IT375_09945 [Polyangiaceae bacterium]|nr:hypothetical protein [Polyangiaceae bacterium]
MNKLGFAFVLASVASSGGLIACSGEDFGDCESNATCGTGGTDAGTGGKGGTGGTSGTGGTGNTGGVGGQGGASGSGGDGGTGCDTTKSPSEAACLVANEFGYFVSPKGDDTSGDGTKDKPFKTIGAALKGTAAKNVYVCDDGTGITETGTIAVTSAHDKRGIFGGFDCTGWAWSTSAKAKVSGAPVALTISNIGQSFRVESLDVTATNAAKSGESSFGAIVSGSKGVVLTGVNLTAGDGKAGEAGGNGTAGPAGADATAAQNGAGASCSSPPGAQLGGSWSGASACGVTGGVGGTAVNGGVGSAGGAGSPKTNVTPPNVDNGGGAGSGTANGNSGTAGSNGNPGTVGPAAASSGTFTSSGFTPANGNDGTNGFPGQGGGGGGASAGTTGCIGASGGAGGMGGCGGGKGTAGKGGGASIALLSWQSDIKLDGCTLTAKKGGDGGKGGDAASGGSGKSGGAGGPAASGLGGGGDGGKGGTGGPGGSGSGGSGGPSIALVYGGTKPSGGTLVEGSGGAKGPGGKLQGSGLNPAPEGSAGTVAKEYEQK